MKKLIALIAIVCYCINPSYANLVGTPFTTTDDVLEQRIDLLNTEVDMRFTDLVRKKIIEFTTYKKGAERLIKKSELYFPIFERQLRKYGVPVEFKYLPIIESNLRTTVRSKAGAVGLWQFMKGTGQAYDLKIGALVDERMDPEKSSEAAAKYLHNLFQQFNDWNLVLAAYNSGAGNVRKAIRKAGSNSYWEINSYLPKETRSYLPKFVAAAYFANYYQHHGINAQTVDFDLVNTISAKIFTEIDFKEIASVTGTPIEVVETLNPEFIKGFIPKSEGEYILTLPSKVMSTFLTSNFSAQVVISSLPSSYKRNNLEIDKISSKIIDHLNRESNMILASPSKLIIQHHKMYKLSKKETLEHVARRNGIALKELLELNNLTEFKLNQEFPTYIKLPNHK